MIRDRLNALDVSLLGHVESQTSRADQRLLALHAAVADTLGQFTYLEIGSYKGGSLQALVADERCSTIVSIDPRPEWTPDDRRGEERLAYPETSADEMLEKLAAVPGADVSKVETIELSTEQVDAASLERPDMCFVDGEHTHGAVLRDARFCRDALRGHGVIAFHDFLIVPAAILEFTRETRSTLGYLLRHDVFVVELGIPTLLSDPRIRQQLRLPAWIWRPLNTMGVLPVLVEARRLRSRLRALRS